VEMRPTTENNKSKTVSFRPKTAGASSINISDKRIENIKG